MAQLLDRVPVDRITVEARQVRPGAAILTVIAGVLFGVGWLTAKVFGLLWLAVAWSAVAVKVGWVEAREGRRSGDAA